MEQDSFTTEELGTESHLFFEDAQRAGLPCLVELLVGIVRQGIEDGRFIVVNGVVRLARKPELEVQSHGGFTSVENDV